MRPATKRFLSVDGHCKPNATEGEFLPPSAVWCAVHLPPCRSHRTPQEASGPAHSTNPITPTPKPPSMRRRWADIAAMPAPTLLYPTHPSVRELKISTLAICCAVRSTYVGELNDAEATEVGEAIVGGILVDNEGDVLHLLGAEPLHHGWNGSRR